MRNPSLQLELISLSYARVLPRPTDFDFFALAQLRTVNAQLLTGRAPRLLPPSSSLPTDRQPARSMLVLYESAVGFVLFKVAKLDNPKDAFDTPEGANNLSVQSSSQTVLPTLARAGAGGGTGRECRDRRVPISSTSCDSGTGDALHHCLMRQTCGPYKRACLATGGPGSTVWRAPAPHPPASRPSRCSPSCRSSPQSSATRDRQENG